MKTGMLAGAVALGFVVVLSACVGSSNETGQGEGLLQGCRSISGGTTRASSTTSAGCTGCGVTDSTRAIDGDGASYATLNMPANAAGTVTLRTTAQPGIVFASGSLAGMVHSISYGTSIGLSVKLNTYLSGSLQEQFNFSSGSGDSSQSPERPGRVSYTTTKQYDAVELSFARTAGTGVVAARVHEFCSN